MYIYDACKQYPRCPCSMLIYIINSHTVDVPRGKKNDNNIFGDHRQSAVALLQCVFEKVIHPQNINLRRARVTATCATYINIQKLHTARSVISDKFNAPNTHSELLFTHLLYAFKQN